MSGPRTGFPEAVQFALFLGALGIFGADLFEGKHALEGEGRIDRLPILIGIVVRFVVSRPAIRVAERLSVQGGFTVFSIYGAAAGTAGLLYFSR
jgi:undecaprenyl pyrophosphate phosphatase UppP